VDAKNGEKRSSGLHESESPQSLPEAVGLLAAAIHEQNATLKQVVLQLLDQNAQLIEALTNDDVEGDEELQAFDISGQPIKVS
jgi:hypothetical protein